MQFSRTVAPDTSKGPALIAFMQHSLWTKIAILTTTESLWFETGLGLKKQLEAAGMQVLKPAAFEPGYVKNATLNDVARSGIRIVLVLSYEDDTRTLASHAERKAMVAGWAWLIVEERIAGKYLAGWLCFRPFLAPETMQEFAVQVSIYTKSRFNISVSPGSVDLTFSAALYDAIMLYALAATKVK